MGTLLFFIFLVLGDGATIEISGKVMGLEVGAGKTFSGAVASKALGAPSGPHTQGARVVLDGFQEVYASSIDGGFKFSDVTPGLHTVEAFQRDLVFMQHKVLVPEEEGKDVVVQRFLYPGAPELVSKLPLEIHPVTLVQYFEDRPPSAVWGLLMNPMVWMAGLFGLLMLFVRSIPLPLGCCLFQLTHNALTHIRSHLSLTPRAPFRCMKGVDPEELKKQQEEQAEALGGCAVM